MADDFDIPMSMFSESLEKEINCGILYWSSKTELLKIIAEEILKYSSNPSPSQRDIVARQLIKKFPNLKSNIGCHVYCYACHPSIHFISVL